MLIAALVAIESARMLAGPAADGAVAAAVLLALRKLTGIGCADGTLAELAARLGAGGLAVDDITEVLPSLEDVFLDVVERAGGARA